MNRKGTPANLKPFQPGQSGNPGGRSKQDINVTELCRAQTEANVATLIKARDDREAAWTVRCHAAEVLLNRAWGTPRQAVEVLGDGMTFVMRLPAPASSSEEWEQEATKLNGRTV